MHDVTTLEDIEGWHAQFDSDIMTLQVLVLEGAGMGETFEELVESLGRRGQVEVIGLTFLKHDIN